MCMTGAMREVCSGWVVLAHIESEGLKRPSGFVYDLAKMVVKKSRIATRLIAKKCDWKEE